MSKQTWVYVNGDWKKVKSAWANVEGQWKKDVMPKGVVNGDWKEFMSYHDNTLILISCPNKMIYHLDDKLNIIRQKYLSDWEPNVNDRSALVKGKYLLYNYKTDLDYYVLVYFDLNKFSFYTNVLATKSNPYGIAHAGDYIIAGNGEAFYRLNLKSEKSLTTYDKSISRKFCDGSKDGRVYTASTPYVEAYDYEGNCLYRRNIEREGTRYLRGMPLVSKSNSYFYLYDEYGGWRDLICLNTNGYPTRTEINEGVNGICPSYDGCVFVHYAGKLRKYTEDLQNILWVIDIPCKSWKHNIHKSIVCTPDNFVYVLSGSTIRKVDGITGDIILEKQNDIFDLVTGFSSAEGEASQS